MSVQMVLLPVFVLVGLTFALLLMMAGVRTRALTSGEVKFKDIALGRNWPDRATPPPALRPSRSPKARSSPSPRT